MCESIPGYTRQKVKVTELKTKQQNDWVAHSKHILKEFNRN